MNAQSDSTTSDTKTPLIGLGVAMNPQSGASQTALDSPHAATDPKSDTSYTVPDTSPSAMQTHVDTALGTRRPALDISETAMNPQSDFPPYTEHMAPEISQTAMNPQSSSPPYTEPTTSEVPQAAMNLKTDSVLFSLPRELRDMIYVEALRATVTIDCISPASVPAPRGLLLACKQTHAETIAVYYKNVTLVFQYSFHFFDRLPLIPAHRLALIPRVELVMAHEAVGNRFCMWDYLGPLRDGFHESVGWEVVWRRKVEEEVAEKGIVLRDGVLTLEKF
ncbi:hypothetical protein LTR37_003259 [Vermiconidia calcicola]|uniref:Uncharacterized protein n=1 Tax=Vermiconidia calcicola TaxID=1690605 RepID=A0ACC3NQP9_9PEZI|nr:hypothetical protein LTR37_003259 [Vermiconidia calcicola]